jgi:hypothetical protein
MLAEKINHLDIDGARREVEPFVRMPENLAIWSRDFFLDVASKIEVIDDTISGS